MELGAWSLELGAWSLEWTEIASPRFMNSLRRRRIPPSRRVRPPPRPAVRSSSRPRPIVVLFPLLAIVLIDGEPDERLLRRRIEDAQGKGLEVFQCLALAVQSLPSSLHAVVKRTQLLGRGQRGGPEAAGVSAGSRSVLSGADRNAGIYRHGVANERVLQGRTSAPP